MYRFLALPLTPKVLIGPLQGWEISRIPDDWISAACLYHHRHTVLKPIPTLEEDIADCANLVTLMAIRAHINNCETAVPLPWNCSPALSERMIQALSS
jgi:hypothetical protein